MNLPYANTLDPGFDVHQATDRARATRVDMERPGEKSDLLHELRQPLEVIDSLAFYLELVSADEQVTGHMQTIRAMVRQVNRVMEERLRP